MNAKQKLMLGAAAGGLCIAAPCARLAAQAFNATPKTVAGFVTYDRATPGVETVFVNTDSAIINWTPTAGIFLPAGNVATFSNGINNTNFAVLNRIISTTPVQFDGSVLGRIQDLAVGTSTPGGTIIFSSPGGIIVGPTGVFDVGNLVLTSLNVIDNAGDFGGTTGNYHFDAGPSPLNSAVVTLPGAQITALNQGSYVAFVAPRVMHGGSVRANGSIAYVAGEVVELRVNNGLFDIIVNAGSDNAIPIMHVGSTGGPASGAADDVHRIYMVAVPKNQAITAVLQGNVGFDPAVIAGVENGAIVLSAGHSVVGGNVDRFANASPAPAIDLQASFHIRGGRISSDLTGVAFTDMLASGQATGNLLFQQDVRLFANRRAHLFAGAGQTVTVLGNALISADRFGSADKNATDLTGGEALIFALNGGSVVINGDTAVTAGAQGQSNAGGAVGSGTGGTAGIFADQGTVQLNREVFVDASGLGAKPPLGSPVGGNGTGGTAFVEGRNGGTVTINSSLDIFATGTASEASGTLPVTGATGLGGTIRLGTSGNGQVTVTGPTVIVADGIGGAVFAGAGNTGGEGRGGSILVTQTGGTINLGGLAGLSANGFGGLGPTGGFGQGGTIAFDVAGAQFQFGGTATLAATGTGGDSGLVGGQGGDGHGGIVRFTARTGGAGSRIGGGAIDVMVTGIGGRGANFAAGTPAGDGGNGRGGDILLLAEAGNAVLEFDTLTASADGLGGQGGGADNAVDGGDGGDGRGGNITIGTTPSAAPPGGGYTRFASVDLRANGIGGDGGLGRGTSGDGTGGAATISADGGPVQLPGTTNLAANGNAGAGGADPTGGGPGSDGQAAGGSVTLAANGANGTLTAGTVTGTASATGAATATNTPGQWHVTANAGGAVNLTNLNLTAAANGTADLPAFSSLEPLGGTITVTGIANLVTPGEIRVLANGAGSLTGGRYSLNAGTDVTFGHAAPVGGGFTIDVADLFVVAGDDFTVGPGVVTRTSSQTDLRVVDLASVSGQMRGNAILLRAATLDVAATGAIGDAGTATTDLQMTGNASVSGQVGGQAIVVRSAGLNVTGTGAVGSTVTTSVDIQATGLATIAGQVRGSTITLRSAGLDIAGTVGGTETVLADVGTTGNAAVSGQIQGATVRLAAGGTLDVTATGSVGTAATANTNVQATGNATVAGQIQGQAIVLRSAGLNVGATGVIGGAGTNNTDILATGAASVAGQIRGLNILLNAASLDLAATGSIGGGAATDVTDVRTAGNAAIAGQVTGRTVRITSSSINVAPTGTVGAAATTLAELRATGAIGVGGRVLGANLLLASADIDLPAGGAIGDAATQRVTLQPNAGDPTATLGGTAQGAGYTLTAAEAARIRAGTLRIDAPAVAGGNALLVRDVTFNGGGAASGIGTLELATPGAIRVEGALLLANAAAGNGIAVNAGERIEISTPTGSIRVRDAAGAPGGTLALTSANIWAASQAILDRLRANPAYAGRDAELLDDGGNLVPRGFIEGNAVTLSTNGTLFVQNTGPGRGTFLTGTEFGGITVGPGGLTVRSTATPATVTAFGRRLNADGTFTDGDDFFFSATFAANGTLASGFTLGSTLNTCIIVTGQCPLRAPPGTGPSGPDPTIGPLGGSASILLPPGSDADDLVDTSFAAEGLIEEPVTSGGDNSLWETDCDRDDDGDCDEGGR